MKKYLILTAVTLLMLLSLSACGKGETGMNNEPTEEMSAQEKSMMMMKKAFEKQLGVLMREEKMFVIAKDQTTAEMKSEMTMQNGVKVAVDGTVTYPSNWKLPENDTTAHMKKLVSEDLVASDGTIIWANGDITMNDGTIVNYGGGVYLTDGTEISNAVILPDGSTTIWADGSVTADGEAIQVSQLPEKKKKLADGTEVEWLTTAVSVMRPNGTYIFGKPDGSGMANVSLAPDGTTIDIDSVRAVKPDQTIIASNEMTLWDGTKISAGSVK